MSTEKDNRMVWDQSQAGRYEVWYATFNHRVSGTGFWIRYTLESPLTGHGEPYCQLWFAMFDAGDPTRNFGINRRLPISELKATDDPFSVRMGEALLEHGVLQGALAGDTHEVSWDLGFKPNNFTHRHLPEMIYGAKFADTKVLSPNLMVNFKGKVVVDGTTYTFDGDPGCQTHLWGKKHAHAWAWSHCNAFREDSTACVETLSVKLKRMGLATPTMTLISLYLGSEVYHFRKLLTLPFRKSAWETGLYTFKGTNSHTRVEGEFRCRPEDLIQTPYEDPDGEASFCHNTEVANASLTVWTRRSATATFRKLARLTSLGCAHFEYAGRTPDGHLTRKHITI